MLGVVEPRVKVGRLEKANIFEKQKDAVRLLHPVGHSAGLVGQDGKVLDPNANFDPLQQREGGDVAGGLHVRREEVKRGRRVGGWS